jgi:hypothetical protein
MPMKNPPHPGDFIRSEIIVPAPEARPGRPISDPSHAHVRRVTDSR